MSVQDDEKTTPTAPCNDARPASSGRRALLKGGVVAMPAILTLQSGAALARSSNLISASSSEAVDRRGRTLCLDTKSVYPAGRRQRYRDVYDLGEPPRAVVNIIRDRDYYLVTEDDDERDFTQVSKGEMCQKGGQYWFKSRYRRRWKSVELPKNGVVVSSGAMKSIAGYVHDNLI